MKGTLLLAILLGCGDDEPATDAGGDADEVEDASDDVDAAPPLDATWVIRGVRVFDGESVRENLTVAVRNAEIVYVGEDRPMVARTEVDGAGRTLLPGLIDAHVHAWSEEQLRQALAFGVTTELDMLGDPEFLRAIRGAHTRGRLADVATLFGSGFTVTVEGGHGTQFFPVPALGPDDDAAAFVEDRIAEGSDHIKLILEDLAIAGRMEPTLTPMQLRDAIVAAQSHGLRAVVHISTIDRAKEAIEAGADGLMHVWADGTDDAFAQTIAMRDRFVVGTLSVLMAKCDGARGPALADDERVAPYLDEASKSSLRYDARSMYFDCDRLREGIDSLHRAGARILAGTDAQNYGTAHGASLHDELALLVDAGLTPIEALTAATSESADAFALEGRGRIEVGARADVIVVEGDPTERIEATLDLVAILHGGIPFDREAYREALAGQ